jgi:4-amino-4-deoxy-L-arabinose transferase-like glycosyltransferase
LPSDKETREEKDTPPENGALNVPESSAGAQAARFKKFGYTLDIALLIFLFALSFYYRLPAMRGDLWLDEADYAFAATRGIHVNRWDISPANDPEKLLRLRHYHAPFTVYALWAAMRFGVDDRTLRIPAAIAGGLSICLVYLTGLLLYQPIKKKIEDNRSGIRYIFTPARGVSLTCGIILALTPPHVRDTSHMLPWPFIILWLMAILYCLVQYVCTKHTLWLALTGISCGMMFVTSEYFFPCLLALVLALPVLFWNDWKSAASRRKIYTGSAAALLCFLIVSWIFWPAGLLRDSFTMLMHYARMANDPWPVRINGVDYQKAPKWAYLYWYWQDYKSFTLFYILGMFSVIFMLIKKMLRQEHLVLIVFTAVVLFTAHKSHIIGPEYLAHALPYLTLVGGLFLMLMGSYSRLLALAGMLLFTLAAFHKNQQGDLSGMDPRAQVPRWSDAAKYLSFHWDQNDRMLASAYGSDARWYIIHYAGVDAHDWQIQALPSGPPTLNRRSLEQRIILLNDIRRGVYRYIAVGNTFSDQMPMDITIERIIDNPSCPWKLVWQSEEEGTGASRLKIYQIPDGVDQKHVLPFPKYTTTPQQLLEKLHGSENKVTKDELAK